MLDMTFCPQCGQPAEVLDRSSLESTDGPVEHVRIRCVNRHWFLLPAATVERYAAPPYACGVAATYGEVRSGAVALASAAQLEAALGIRHVVDPQPPSGSSDGGSDHARERPSHRETLPG